MDFPVGNVVTAFATVVSVVIANRLSSTQSGWAKLWDFRRQAYGVILSESPRWKGSAIRRITIGRKAMSGYFESESRDAINTQIAEHMGTVRKRFSDDYLILSDPFIALFETFIADLEAGPPNEMYRIPATASRKPSASIVHRC